MNMISAIWEFSDVDLIVAFHNNKDCSDAEWEAYLNLLNPYNAKRKQGDRLRGLTLTDGGGPNAKQRSRLIQTVDSTRDPKAFRGAVLSESATIRGIVTALQWLRPSGLKCFPPQSFLLATNYVGVRREECAKVLSDGALLAKQVGCHTFERAIQAQMSLQKVG